MIKARAMIKRRRRGEEGREIVCEDKTKGKVSSKNDEKFFHVMVWDETIQKQILILYFSRGGVFGGIMK